MTRDEKLDLIGKFENAYRVIDELIEGIPEEGLRFVPALSEAWSINDHLAHILDADTVVYFRLRVAIAEPGYEIPVWNEEAWCAKLCYGAEDGKRCIELAKGLRSTVASSLRALIDEEWTSYWIKHPSRGRIRLEELLEAYRDHVAFHVPFIKRNRDAFRVRES